MIGGKFFLEKRLRFRILVSRQPGSGWAEDLRCQTNPHFAGVLFRAEVSETCCLQYGLFVELACKCKFRQTRKLEGEGLDKGFPQAPPGARIGGRTFRP